MQLFSHKTGSILGGFSKGVANSVSINFGLSGGKNCDKRCPHLCTVCYAQNVEKRGDRIPLKNKLARHQKMSPALLCGRALVELQTMAASGIIIPWVRISTGGSVPMPAVVRGDKFFASQMRALLMWCAAQHIPVHFPVETHSKARFFRAVVGPLATVRESAVNIGRFFRAIGAVSVVAGNRGQTMLDRIATATATAKQRTQASGRKCIVCPAVTAGFKYKLSGIRWRTSGKKIGPQPQPNLRAKCGNCTACADDGCDVVYPLH
jgi:hypothetical protein